MADVKALAEELVNLSVKDVQELAKVLKEEYAQDEEFRKRFYNNLMVFVFIQLSYGKNNSVVILQSKVFFRQTAFFTIKLG